MEMRVTVSTSVVAGKRYGLQNTFFLRSNEVFSRLFLCKKFLVPVYYGATFHGMKKLISVDRLKLRTVVFFAFNEEAALQCTIWLIF